jgi:hypothetical protein
MVSLMYYKKGLLGLVALITISFISLAINYLRAPVTQVIINEDVIKSSPFDVAVYNNAGGILFSMSPLNDFFYTNKAKDHFADKIISSNNAGFAQDLWSNLQNLALNKKELIWNFTGSNRSNKTNISYETKQINGGVAIQRTFSPSAGVTSLGQVIKFCADCLVTDDKNRAYFNADTIQQFDIDTAKRLNLVPIVVSESQFLPKNITKIKIIDRNNNLKIEIPVRANQVYLQYKWRILEFKTNLLKGETSVSQEVLLYE